MKKESGKQLVIRNEELGMNIAVDNLKAFRAGKSLNVVDK